MLLSSRLPLEKGVGGIAKGADDILYNKFAADPSAQDLR